LGRPQFTPRDKQKYFALRAEGWGIAAAAREVGCSERTAAYWEKDPKTSKSHGMGGAAWKVHVAELKLPEPSSWADLIPEARDALDDFEKFRLRYLGHVSTPWQVEAANDVVRWLESDEKEFVVVNCPPGAGKSTLFTHDIPVWVIARNRGVRIIIGSRTQRQAKNYALRVRRTLERTQPYKPPSEQVARGDAVEAVAALAVDYGRFKPTNGDLWRAEEFVVAQEDDQLLEDKEPTVASYGQDTGILGNRADLVVWDDLVDKTTLKTSQAIEDQRAWWDDEAETRLEPGGLLILQGQRMGAEDLYRYALDLRLDQDELGDDDDQYDTLPRKYRHVIYRAHDEDKCTNNHAKDAPAWPEGCLLDPRRLPWKGRGGLGAIRTNKESKYRVQYQQEDVDPASVLVPSLWVKGGRDPESGEVYPGCWDEGRKTGEIPQGLSSPLFSVCTVDPSPTKFWSIQRWLYHPATQQRFLIDLVRQSMDAPDFLDWLDGSRTFVGLMNDWQIISERDGAPITHWIVEHNAAQRFLLQYDHVHRWQRAHQTTIIAHNTAINKVNDDYGITSVKNPYRFGQVRLPGHRDTRTSPLKLVDEATHYPDVRTDDCVMAQWFLEFNIPRLFAAKRKTRKGASRPSWSGTSRTGRRVAA
jgi:hypothetical protein